MTIKQDNRVIGRLPAPGDVINGNYRLGDAFASGGMGVIMRAEQIHAARDVAIKFLHPHIAGRDNFAARFKREVQVATLFNHPAIVRVYDVGETDDGVLFFVMELLEGEELKQIIRHEGPMAAGRAIDIALQMLDGLAEAHSHDVIHRDIKPSNVFIRKNRRGEDMVKLLDFGVAKLVNGQMSDLTSTGAFTGTPSYIAPEMMVAEAQTNLKAADVYAAGLVLLEMLTGKKAFRGDGLHQTMLLHLKRPVLIPQLIDNSALSDVIRKATQKHPDDRYQDADEMYVALKAAQPLVDPNLRLQPELAPDSSTVTSPSILEELAQATDPDKGLELLRLQPQHRSYRPENHAPQTVPVRSLQLSKEMEKATRKLSAVDGSSEIAVENPTTRLTPATAKVGTHQRQAPISETVDLSPVGPLPTTEVDLQAPQLQQFQRSERATTTPMAPLFEEELPPGEDNAPVAAEVPPPQRDNTPTDTATLRAPEPEAPRGSSVPKPPLIAAAILIPVGMLLFVLFTSETTPAPQPEPEPVVVAPESANGAQAVAQADPATVSEQDSEQDSEQIPGPEQELAPTEPENLGDEPETLEPETPPDADSQEAVAAEAPAPASQTQRPAPRQRTQAPRRTTHTERAEPTDRPTTAAEESASSTEQAEPDNAARVDEILDRHLFND